MSANNYILVQEINGKSYVWDNLNAEEAVKNKVLTRKNVDGVFQRLETAVEWAREIDNTEYGIQINDPYKPKDGFKEKINV